MKLLFVVASAALGINIGRENAAGLLHSRTSRARRANEGWFSETTSGNLERECIEESCDDQEFHEVYDDYDISEPKYLKYLDCLNYINKSVRFQESGKQLLRACVDRANNGPQRPIEPIATQKPQPRPPVTKPPVTSRPQLSEVPQWTKQPQWGTNQPSWGTNQPTFASKVEMPSCSQAGWGFLCGDRIPNGYPNKNDPLFQYMGTTVNAAHVNRVYCRSVPTKGYTGYREHNCEMAFETRDNRSCTLSTTIRQSSGGTTTETNRSINC